jgi:3-oxoadipate enol-lactonase
VARFRRRLVTTDATGYVGCCEAVGKVDTTARLGQIAVPTLVIAGELDQGTPVAMAQVLAEAIPGARLEVLAEASHLSAAEQPEAFARLVTGFVDEL